MSERILVAVDLSDASLEVLREGRALATARGAQLAAVHVASRFADVHTAFPLSDVPNLTSALELSKSLAKYSIGAFPR